MIRIFLKSTKIILKNFKYKNINQDYQNWFNGNNENLKFSRHYKKKYSRFDLIKNLNKINNSKNLFIGIFDINSKKLIGTITVYINYKTRTGNIGIFIGNKKLFFKRIRIRKLSPCYKLFN